MWSIWKPRKLVDLILSGELGVLPGYGNKKTMYGILPYGICAYSRSQSQYWNGTNGEYMLNEDEIYQMLNTMGAPVEMVPNSQREKLNKYYRRKKEKLW